MFDQYMKLRNKYPETPAHRILGQLRHKRRVDDFGLENSCYHYDNGVEITYNDMPDNTSIVVTVKPDSYGEPPWDFCEGYGTIKPMQRYAEYPGNGNVQIRSYGRENYYYNFAEALEKARKDFYNPKVGKAENYRKALNAVKREMKHFEGYVCDDWYYVSINVKGYRDNEEVFDEWVGMYESDYWHEGAWELIHDARHAISASKYAGSTVGVL